MAFIVEMARGRPYQPGHETWSCSGDVWDRLLALARQFGWNPQGTAPEAYSGLRAKDYLDHFKPDYRPQEWQHCKVVQSEDAAALADALDRASAALRRGEVAMDHRPGAVLFRDGMTAEELARANAGPLSLIEPFARFARSGAFAFAWDD